MSCVLLQLNTDHWLWFVICFLTLLRKFHMECRENLPKNIYFHKTACETIIDAEKQILYYGAMLVKLTSLIGNWQHCCLFWYCELIVVVGAFNCHFIVLLTGRGDCYSLVVISHSHYSCHLHAATTMQCDVQEHYSWKLLQWNQYTWPGRRPFILWHWPKCCLLSHAIFCAMDTTSYGIYCLWWCRLWNLESRYLVSTLPWKK